MVKKRLSDLLREEGEKPEEGAESAEQSSESAKGADVVEAPKTVGAKEAMETTIDVAAEVVATEVELAKGGMAELQAAEASKQAAIQTGSQLEATILQLKQDIEAAQRMAQDAEAVFNQQLATLQAKLVEQNNLIQQLNAEAEAATQQSSQQVTQLKAELETARQTILKLSQVNPPKAAAVAPAPVTSARPGATFLGRSQPPIMPSPAVLPSTRAAEPELESRQSHLIIPGRPAKPIPDRSTRHELELHKVLDHPTQPGSLPPMSSEPKPAEKESVKLSETDVGWMD